MSRKLFSLCSDGKLEEVRSALRRGDNVNSRGPPFKGTALMHAIAGKHTPVVKLLLEQPLLGVNSKDEDGATALHYAVIHRNPEALELLLSDSRLNSVDPVTSSGETPLMMAVRMKRNAMVRVLLAQDGVDVNRKRREDGKTIVHMAALCNNVEGLKLILADRRLSTALNTCDIEFCSPLMLAVAEGQRQEVVRRLLKHPGVDVNQTNKGGHSALHYAAMFGRTEEARLILTQSLEKVDLNIQEVNTGQMALHVAVFQHNNDIVQLLLEHPDLDVNCVDFEGNNILVYALAHGNSEAEQMLATHPRFNVSKQSDKESKITFTPFNPAFFPFVIVFCTTILSDNNLNTVGDMQQR